MPTAAQDRAAERRARFAELAKQIGAMSEEERFALAAGCPIVTVEGRAVSTVNACLLASQLPGVTIVGGFRQWLKAGRVVRKGEHGLSLWIPTSRKQKDQETGEDTGERRTGFIMGTVFDVSQTVELEAGAPVDELAAV